MIKILYESDLLGWEQGACVSCRFLHDLIHLRIHLALAHVQRKKEAISCTRLYVQDWRWIGNVSTSYPCDLISLHWFLRQYLCLYKTSCWGKMVTSPRRSVTDTSGLTSAGCHLTHLASDLGQAHQKYVCKVYLWAAYNNTGTMALSGFDPYHGLWCYDAPSKCIVTTPTLGVMIAACCFVWIPPQPSALPYYLECCFCDFLFCTQ